MAPADPAAAGGPQPKLKPEDCRHLNFAARVNVIRLEDSGTFSCEVTVHCTECDEPFRFIGVDSGFDPAKPMVSIDGLELRAPIEPEMVKKLHAMSSFVVPPALPKGN